MLVRCFRFAIFLHLAALFCGVPVLSQSNSLSSAVLSTPGTNESATIEAIHFAGLRRTSAAAVAAQMTSHPGSCFQLADLDRDLRSLARLGWFDSIQVEAIPLASESGSLSQVTLSFRVVELPYLSRVQFSGSRLLAPKQIEKILEDNKLTLKLGAPADPSAIHRSALAIRAALNELGHPDATIRIARAESSNATLSLRFDINDGPLLRVRSVSFDGHPQLPVNRLRSQMRNVSPWKPFASWRGKNSFSRDAFEDDRQRLLTYYQDHGFPEARVGNGRVERFTEISRHWLPWPHRATNTGLSVSIPMEAGSYYHFESITASDALLQAAALGYHPALQLGQRDEGHAFSQQEIDKLRRAWLSRIQTRGATPESALARSIDVTQSFNPETHAVRVHFDLASSRPYIVQRIQFLGLHKFSDRYVRRRILLREGHPVDERALEAGLRRLARTGYFKPIRKEDIHVQLDEATHTANVSIHIQEIGRQRASFSGGPGQFGSTLGLAYTIFDLLNCEELLSAQFDAGPETLQVALGLAKEGIFGTRASLAISVFNNVIRPRLAASAKGPFFTSRTEGISIPLTYPLTDSDLIGVHFVLSRTTSDYPLGTPPGLTGLPPLDIESRISSRSFGVGWARDTGNQRISLSDSASGGFLGGGENMVRSSTEASRIFRDPFFSEQNAWAFRTTFTAEGSYRGDMPYYARFFSADELVRGLRPGELGPYSKIVSTGSSGASIPSAAPAGANLLAATTAEYRVPLGGGTQAAAFFDLGSGRLLPNWLGPSKPVLLAGTNGVFHGSTGMELRWTVPGVQVPVRAYYAFNVIRLDRFISLSDKSRFFAHDRFSCFGWGLGSLF